jgi:hypothetical protein
MVRTHHKGQPTIVTDQPFIVALQFNYSCLGIEIRLADEFAWVTRTAFSLVPVLEAGGIVTPFVHITRSNNVVNMNPRCIIEIRIFRIDEGLEYLSTDVRIRFVDHFLVNILLFSPIDHVLCNVPA